MSAKRVEENHVVITDEEAYNANKEASEQSAIDEITGHGDTVQADEEKNTDEPSEFPDEFNKDESDETKMPDAVYVTLIRGSTYLYKDKRFTAGVPMQVNTDIACRLLKTNLFRKG